MRYFKIEDFNCKETGENEMCPNFLARLDELRHRCGFPFIVTSGYRSSQHSIEKRKSKAGTHAQGIAADINVSGGSQRYIIQKHAYEMGFQGIGEHKTFIHVDDRKTTPVSWPY
ncbi:MAG: D-Ala-D-Ala carboxypeptidase family metallohydrolase [Flavobacteriaceae bacterium]|nr:D-Ala-D-Ala carboxypeptidase family metallohydrolase [Flavobacteriaceae bacterium]